MQELRDIEEWKDNDDEGRDRDGQSSSTSVRLLVAARLQTEDRTQRERPLQAAPLITPSANDYAVGPRPGNHTTNVCSFDLCFSLICGANVLIFKSI